MAVPARTRERLLVKRQLFLLSVIVLVVGSHSGARADEGLFRDRVVPILARRCLSCHDDTLRRGDLSLRTNEDLHELGYVVPGDPAGSYLLELITPSAGAAEMPKDSDPLKADEIKVIRDWIAAGGEWPDNVAVEPLQVTDRQWWSLQPLLRPPVPQVPLRVRQTRRSDYRIAERIAQRD